MKQASEFAHDLIEGAKEVSKKLEADSKEGLHTQGEWELVEVNSVLMPFRIMKGETEIAAIRWGIKQCYPETHEEVKANAELIVKAVNERKALTDELGTAYNKIEDLKDILEQTEFSKKKLEDERKALLDALESLVKAYDLKMGKSALQLRIDLAKDALNNAKNI